jgi:XisI protein
MEKVGAYREVIQGVLENRSKIKPSYGDIERFTAFVTQNEHYQVLSVGWEGHRRIYGCLIHIDIKDGKIWIQYDGTEDGVANELVELGVPKLDVVLAYQSPYARQYTDFAIG